MLFVGLGTLICNLETVSKDQRALDRVAQLPDVPRPFVDSQSIDAAFVDGLNALAECLGKLIDE